MSLEAATLETPASAALPESSAPPSNPYDYGDDDREESQDAGSADGTAGDGKPAGDGQAAAKAPETPAPAQKPAAQQQAQQPTIGADLILKAARLGLSQEEALAYETPAQLGRALTHMEGIAQRFAPPQQPTAQPQQQQRQELPPEKGGQQQQPPPAAATKYVPKLGDDYPPEVVKEFTDLHAHFEQRLAQFEGLTEKIQKLESFHQHVEEQQLAARFNWFDQAVSDLVEELGDEFDKVVGREPGHKLQQGDARFSARSNLYGAFAQIERTNPNMSPAEVLKLAASALHPDIVTKANQQRQQEATRKLFHDQRGRFTSPPSDRDMSGRLSRDEIAYKNAGERLQKFGLDGGDDEVSDENLY